ncbi:MAG TPA: hypothetical protein V6C76_12235 [Drouetiella sp.]
MNLKSLVATCVCAFSIAAPFANAQEQNRWPGLSDAVVLVIRHAEKPDSGDGLTPAGKQRAQAYVKYFEPFNDGKESFNVDALYATSDTSKSARPKLTLEPLSEAIGVPIDSRFGNYDGDFLVESLRKQKHGKHALIAWHHGHIPDLLRSLGADPTKLLPNGKWPATTYDWVIELKYDKNSKLLSSQRIQETL